MTAVLLRLPPCDVCLCDMPSTRAGVKVESLRHVGIPRRAHVAKLRAWRGLRIHWRYRRHET
jgi:hypothetical protein